MSYSSGSSSFRGFPAVCANASTTNNKRSSTVSMVSSGSRCDLVLGIPGFRVAWQKRDAPKYHAQLACKAKG